MRKLFLIAFWHVTLLYFRFLRIFGILGRFEHRTRKAQIKSQIRFIKQKNLDYCGFADWTCNHQLDKSNFVSLSNRNFQRQDSDVKLIAYYLPQFYEFSINNKWFGKGFTEWSNVAKATPQFIGHQQPKLPIDVGFYNLETTRTMHRQAELAKQYGIYGFCYYYYWFHGERIMEKPIFNMLADKSLDMPFCLMWCNEKWTNNWEDSAKRGDIAFDPSIEDGDAEKFVVDIAAFWQDPRYIKFDGQPVLVIYRNRDPRIAEFIAEIKKIAKQQLCIEPYIMLTDNNKPLSGNGEFPLGLNADAGAEFHITNQKYANKYRLMNPHPTLFNKRTSIKKFDTHAFIRNKNYLYQTEYPVFRGAMTSFDNTSRKAYNTGAQIWSITPEMYKEWLSDVVKWTIKNHKPDKRFAFVSAWNEWAECMCLEPDQHYGYAYLQATREALEENR